MAGARRSARIARRDATTNQSDNQSNAITTAASDPSIPSSDGTCHFMRLPVELRLAIAEDVFEDFFKRLTLGLYPPFLLIGESWLPGIQKLYSVLHLNHAFRLETIDLCTRLAKDAAEEVVSHPPGDFYHQATRQRMRVPPHEQLKSKLKKILRILQKAKVSTSDAE